MKLQLENVNLNVEISGKSDGPTVILSHSLACSLEMWKPQLDVLEPEFNVVRYDIRGHGQSDAPQGHYAMDMLGKDAVELMDKLNIESAHWVGISLGGMIGQYVASEHPHRLKSLILCDTSPDMPEETQPFWQEKIDTAISKGLEALLPGTLQGWFTSSYLEKKTSELDSIRKQFLATSIDGYLGCIWAIRRLHYIERLKAIQAPTLIVVGRQDLGTPVEISEMMHGMIPQSKLVIIDDAAHLSSINQPEKFNDVLISFLKQLSF